MLPSQHPRPPGAVGSETRRRGLALFPRTGRSFLSGQGSRHPTETLLPFACALSEGHAEASLSVGVNSEFLPQLSSRAVCPGGRRTRQSVAVTCPIGLGVTELTHHSCQNKRISWGYPGAHGSSVAQRHTLGRGS